MMSSGSFFITVQEQTFNDGQIIFQEGNSGDWVYVVLSGSVEISKNVEGKKFIVSIVEPGNVFGELALIGAIKRPTTAMAIGTTTVGVVDRSFLDSEFNKLSSDFRAMLVTMVKRFSRTAERIRDFSDRRHKRVFKKLSVRFKDRMTFVTAYTNDISAGGLFVKTDKPLGVGEQFFLELQLPEHREPLKIMCQVAWVRKDTGIKEGRPNGMGVKFSDMNSKDRQILQQYVGGVLNQP